jgi:hypothetical protein
MKSGNRLLNSLAYQVPKIDSSLDDERMMKIYNAMKRSEPFKDDESLNP